MGVQEWSDLFIMSPINFISNYKEILDGSFDWVTFWDVILLILPCTLLFIATYNFFNVIRNVRNNTSMILKHK